MRELNTLVLLTSVAILAALPLRGVEKATKQPTVTKETKPTEPAKTKKANKSDKKSETVVFSYDFTNAPEGDAQAWLEKEGFQLEKGMAYADQIEMKFKDKALHLNAKTPVLGVAIKQGLKIKEFAKIRITWGINEFPKGASYDKKVNNEAVMIYIYFGDKKLSSDSMFIPNAPYFLGLFLAESDTLDKAYTGRHFTQGGRFICVGKPKKGETVITEFDLVEAFKSQFKQQTVPHISGLNLEVDTSYVKPGTANAFIKKIEIIK